MELHDRLDGDVVVIELGGKLISCEELRELRERVRTHLECNRRRFVVDLEHVNSAGSEGLGSLIAAYTSVKQADGRFVLANIDNVHNLLTITKLYGVFESYGSCEEALRAARS